jgi:hypothetical protein
MAPDEQSPVLQPKAADDVLVVGMVATVRIGPLFQSLLNSAQQLLSDHHYGAAVLVAETAIEVCTERIIARALEKAKAGSLGDWITTSLRGRPYILTNPRITDLYKRLTGDAQIAQSPFWSRLQNHVTRRHLVAHKGQSVGESEASESLDVVLEAIQHISRVAEDLKLDLSDR